MLNLRITRSYVPKKVEIARSSKQKINMEKKDIKFRDSYCLSFIPRAIVAGEDRKRRQRDEMIKRTHLKYLSFPNASREEIAFFVRRDLVFELEKMGIQA